VLARARAPAVIIPRSHEIVLINHNHARLARMKRAAAIIAIGVPAARPSSILQGGKEILRECKSQLRGYRCTHVTHASSWHTFSESSSSPVRIRASFAERVLTELVGGVRGEPFHR